MQRFAFTFLALFSALPPCQAQPRQPPPSQGPWQNDLVQRIRSESNDFGAERVFVERAGVPSLARDHEGRLGAAFQWFPADDREAFDKVAIAISADQGKTWTRPQTAAFHGLPPHLSRPFDPTLVVLDDGRIRLYFTSNPTGNRLIERDSTAIYSAVSDNGLDYEFEPGERFGVAGERVLDCAVLRLGKTWHMYAPIGRPEDGAYHAESADGLTFTRQADIPSLDGVNWTGNLVAYEQGMRFYGSSRQGLWHAFSADGRTWTAPTFLGFRGGDPASVFVTSAQELLIYVSTPRRDRDGARPPFPPDR